MKNEIAVAFGGRIFSDIKLAEKAFELIFLIDVVIVFEHGDCKALAESARADEEEIHVFADCEKEIYLEDAYVYMFEEDSGFAKYKKYEIKDELILSKYSYASIQLFELDNDIVINIKNKIISKNHNVFVDYRLQNRFEMNNVIAILNLRLIVTEQFVLINQPNSVTINLNSRDEFRYRQYQYINPSLDCEIHRNKKEVPKLLIEFRQFDKIITHEKMSNLIMVVPMLMMSLASLVVGINSSYNSYLQGKDGFDLAIPLILPWYNAHKCDICKTNSFIY